MLVARAISVVLAVAVLGCGPIDIELKPRAVSVEIPAGTTTSVQQCSGAPLVSAALDFEKLAKEAGVDLSAGCLKSGAFDMVAEVKSLTGGTSPTGPCTEPRGTVTINELALDFVCSDATTKTLRQACPSPTITVADGTDVFVKVNACLDAFEAAQTEAVRKIINTCRPKSVTATTHGGCSTNTCFTASFKFTFKITNATARLGGGCP